MVLKIVIKWNAFHCQYIIERTTSRMCCVHIVKCYDIDTANGCSQCFLSEVCCPLIVCRIAINFCNLKKAGIIRIGEMTQNNPSGVPFTVLAGSTTMVLGSTYELT